MQPPAEMVHWLFGAGFLLLGLCLLGEALVGGVVWGKRRWRPYLWPSLAFGLGVLMWPVMAFYTNSAIHMLAHGAWAQTMMAAGAAELGLVHGKLESRLWRLLVPLALVVSGTAFLVHEQNGWLFSRSAFLHHAVGWWLVLGAAFPLLRVFRPRSQVVAACFATIFVGVSVMLFSDRDTAPIFGHLSPLAGKPHR
jgi:hypothetical protein